MGSRAIDMTGQTFGRLTVLKVDASKPRNHQNAPQWICRCQCGVTTSVRGTALRNRHIQSCGCWRREVLASHARRSNLIGRVFGRLRVLDGPERGHYECRCECGRKVTVRSGLLVSRNTQSCGCSQGIKRRRSRIAARLPAIHKGVAP